MANGAGGLSGFRRPFTFSGSLLAFQAALVFVRVRGRATHPTLFGFSGCFTGRLKPSDFCHLLPPPSCGGGLGWGCAFLRKRFFRRRSSKGFCCPTAPTLALPRERERELVCCRAIGFRLLFRRPFRRSDSRIRRFPQGKMVF
ncbi:hypothetical protein HMPREF9120_02498 [Neisseria sp. oral taxon 020 str. F0370]|nr:hypothetical protein HMPREF9120_02498 [Neisseria sp. oral taxon 020 str. F0370]